MNKTAAIIVLGPGGLSVARTLADGLPGARLHGAEARIDEADIRFASFADHVRTLFEAGTPIIALCATGALIRVLAPLLGDKKTEPPVIAVAEDGSAVVPLLGGHHGANDLARRIARILQIKAAITTAGDVRFGIALDAPPTGFRLANPHDMKPFVAALLAGDKARLNGTAPWLAKSRLPFAEDAALTLTVSDQAMTGDHSHLIYHPATLAVGVGCERGAATAEVLGLIEETLAGAGLAAAAVSGIFSIDLKADEDALHAAAAALGVEARFFSAARLESEAPRLLTPSDTVFREVGCHGVAEGAALAAAGDRADLIVAKRKSQRATCAIARADALIDTAQIGQARGHLAVVGIGPGSAEWRTPAAEALLGRATDLVGYRLYLDLIGRLGDGKTRHDYALGEERDRVRAALDLAAAGKRVALVCSGDPGIYAMATLVFEEIDREGRPDWGRVAIDVTPGISAMQATAARIGAPLGHDFCAISLSDLLTPWSVIEARLRAAAAGDFVVALYNPVSQRRRHQLMRARDILLEHRPADTPVVIGRNLGRQGEDMRVVRLADLEADMADMLVSILIGSSTTRAVPKSDGSAWIYTPRGYAAKTPMKKAGDAA